MLIVRHDQIEIFEDILGFEYKMIQHCQRFFPLPSEMLGESQIRKIIQYGAGRAEKHGFSGRREKCVYISIMMLLGSDFDEDFQLPWAADLLKDQSIQDPFKRIERIYNEILNYLDRVAGPQNQYMIEAMEKIRSINVHSLTPPVSKNFGDGIYALLTDIYPERSRYQGKPIMDELCRKGIQSAKQYGLTQYKNACVICCLMFMLGSGFADDLQFPWVSRVLNDPSLKEEDAKTERLYKLTMMLLNRVLAQVNS